MNLLSSPHGERGAVGIELKVEVWGVEVTEVVTTEIATKFKILLTGNSYILLNMRVF